MPLPSNVIWCKLKDIQFKNIFCKNDKTLVVISQSLLKGFKSLGKGFPKEYDIISLSASHPTLDDVKRIPLPKDATQVIAIGGGSIIDISKLLFLKILSEESYSFDELISSSLSLVITEERRKQCKLIFIPSIFGSSAEFTQWATFWDKKNKKKISLQNKRLISDTVYIIPELSQTAPVESMIVSGFDALSHAFDSLWNSKRTEESQKNALKAIELYIQLLPQLTKTQLSPLLREELAQASIYSAHAFSRTESAGAHALSYPLTLFKGIPHGIATSLTLGELFQYVESTPAQYIGEVRKLFMKRTVRGRGEEFSQLYRRFLEECNIKAHLRHYGVKKEELELFINTAHKQDRLKNMRPVLNKKKIRAIYENIY